MKACDQSGLQVREGTGRAPIWRPEAASIARTQMAAFQRFCEGRTGECFPAYDDFHRFSVTRYRDFWRLFLDWSGQAWSEQGWAGDRSVVCSDDRIEHARFFPDLTLNYAQVLLSDGVAPDDAPALTVCRADGRVERISRGALRARVTAGAAALRTLGADPRSRVALIANNDAAAVIGTLSALAVGAAVAMSAPEMGADATIARLRAVEPDFLLCHARTVHGGGEAQLRARLEEIVRALPSLRAVVLLDAEPSPTIGAGTLPCHHLTDLLAAHADAAPAWPALPFNHPLLILFSSGTTGTPKAIVHGAGGTLIEHLKEHRLHCDLRADDRLFFQTSTAWMMWVWSLSALACGVELVLYAGPGAAETLWRMVAERRVTVFGTGPSYLQMSERAGISPARDHDFGALRAVLSTGSLLFAPQQAWFGANVKDLPIQSISGGTDIVGCFVLGNPTVPAFAGEPQCKGLGFDLRARSSSEEAVGELVCANPFPSRPLGFLHDPEGARFHQAYFADNPGLWTHGDLVAFQPDGSVAMHGRADGVMNIRGIRIGPAELYRVLEEFPEIAEALAVEQSAPDEVGHARIVLLLVLTPGVTLDDPLQARLRRAIGSRTSGAHVPAIIMQVDELPTTHTGKRSERSARDAVNGILAADSGALRNPDCLARIAAHPALARESGPPAGVSADAPSLRTAQGRIDESALTRLWERTLGIAPIGRDDDFFDIGADSLGALALLFDIEKALGIALPITFIYEAPSIARMVARLESVERAAFSHLVPIKAGSGPPLYIVHGLGGNTMELFRLGRLLACERPVYAIQARGLDGVTPPIEGVEAMAEAYIAAIRAHQPTGPYQLCGYSFGGLIAFEMARRLQAAGAEVGRLILLDATFEEPPRAAGGRPSLKAVLLETVRGMRPAAVGNFYRFVRERLESRWHRRDLGFPLPSALTQVLSAARQAIESYRPGAYAGDIILMHCTVRHPLTPDAVPSWAALCRHLTVHDIIASHHSMLRDPAVLTLAREMSPYVA